MNQYDKLKNKLHHYKVEIDKEKLWANTSHAIPQRKRRRAVLIMLFGTLVVSAWLLHSTFLVPGSERILSSNDNKNNSAQLVQNLQDNTFEGKNNSQQTPNTFEVVSSKLSKSVEEVVEAINTLPEDKFSNPFTGQENTQFENREHHFIKSQILRSPLKTFPLPILPLSPMFRRLYTSLLSAQQPGRQKILSERNMEAQIAYSIQIHNEDQNEITDAQNVHLVEKFIIPDQTDRVVKVPVAYLFKVVSQIPITESAVATANSYKPNIKPLKARFLKSLQMVQGFGFSTMKIQSLRPESELYASQLEQKIRSLEVLSTTLSATINLPVGFSLETGLQMSRLSTVIEHQWETNERIREEGLITIIIDEHGIPQSIIGNRDVTRTTDYQAKRFTSHQNIDFVLALHKVIWNEQRLSMNAFVKGAYNLSYDAKGTMLDNNGELVSFLIEENPFRKISPFSIGGGLQMMYQLNPHWNLTGNFTFDPLRYKFKDENIPVRFIHSELSFGLGLGYVF